MARLQTGSPLYGEHGSEQFKVLGTVQRVDGSPVPNALIKAVDVDLRREEVLGRSSADDKGHYEICYSKAQFSRQEKRTADLKIYAYQSDKSVMPPIATTEINFNAGPIQTVNVVVGGDKVVGPSEFASLSADVLPLLRDLRPEDIVEDDIHQDISFLAAETGRDKQQIVCFAIAHQNAVQAKLPAEVFYGLIREGISANLAELLVESEESLGKALRAAVGQNIVQAYSEAEITYFLSELHQLGMLSAVHGRDGPTAIGQVLSTVSKNTELFMDIFSKHAGSTEELWASVDANPEFKGQTPALQFAVQLGITTLNHAPLVKELQSREDIKELRDLTKFTVPAWIDIIRTSGAGAPDIIPGDTSTEKARNYAIGMSRLIEDSFPTAFIANRLQDADDDKTHDGLSGKQDINIFFAANPEFSIMTDRVPAFLESDPAVVTGVKDVETLKANISTMQRIYRVAPQYAQMRKLLSNGIRSSMQITNMGLPAFTAKFGDLIGGPAESARIYGKASRAHAMAYNLLATFSGASSLGPSSKWPDWGQIVAGLGTEETGIPDWSTLFGSIDVCTCSECRSTTSPAAYYVDILHFLQQRMLVDLISRNDAGEIIDISYKTTTDSETRKTVTKTAKDVLFERRPDLGQIELSCQNTNLPLPYVDLTNEILENAVKPPDPLIFKPFDLPSIAIDQLDSLQAGGVRNVFQEEEQALSDFPEVAVIKSGQWWTIEEPTFTYTVRKVGPESDCRVTARSLQTKGTSLTRAATPQYTNAKAYDTLRSQVYPWNLPFDLWNEVARTYLAHVAVGRYELMEVFLTDSREKGLTESRIVREFLALSLMEEKLILGQVTSQEDAANPGPWNLWGFAAENLSLTASIPDPKNRATPIKEGKWSDVLTSRVDIFLQQSGMEFIELLNLIEISNIFFVEGGSMNIFNHNGAPADTCDPSKMSVMGTDETILLKIFRFFKLLRNLDGWTVLDLGLTLRYLGFPGTQDATTKVFVAISHMKRLMEALDLSLEYVITFWYPISSIAYDDHANSDEDAVFESLYSRLFRNQTIASSVEQRLPQNPLQLSGNIADYSSTLAAALNVSPIELTTILDSNLILTGNDLSLDSLSQLFRHVLLAKSLEVSIMDYLSILRLVNSNPFASTITTVRFVERVQAAVESGFSWVELNDILRNDLPDGGSVSSRDQAIISFLRDIRSGLRTVVLDNSADGGTVDANGDFLKKKLALLSWDASIISQAIAILNDTASFSAPLDTPPPAFDLPQIQDRMTYDRSSAMLLYSRVMTTAERGVLRNIQGASPQFLTAVQRLYQAPRDFFFRYLRSFSVPDFAVKLNSMPMSVNIPLILRGKVYFVQSNTKLHSIGALTDSELQSLLAVATPGTDDSYISAINALYRAPNTYGPASGDQFLAASDVSTLFDSVTDSSGVTITPSFRYNAILRKLLPFLREKLSNQYIREKVSELIDVKSQVCEKLLTAWVLYDSRMLNAVLRTAAFVESSDESGISQSSFPDQYNATTRLIKIGIVINNLKLSAIQLSWLFEFRRVWGDPATAWLDLNKLPVTLNPSGYEMFAGWERLIALTMVRDGLEGGESVLDDIFRTARSSRPTYDRIIQLLAKDLKVPPEAIEFLVKRDGFNLPLPASFIDEAAIKRILRAVKLFRDVGCSPLIGSSIAQENIGEQQARIVQLAVKSKYDQNTWDTVAPQLSNVLREAQRVSLIAYLLAHPPAGASSWNNANDLFAYYLIDVEMGPCQKTSRIKQAICSVQLFAQRCIMNLEPEVKANTEADVHWKQWEWMKSYSIAAANRKIFETPENYLEPSVRDDKTVFFTELESELRQADVTQATVETALLNYLEKLDQVARMDVVSFYHQEEFDGHGNRAVDVIHIFARTMSKPYRYFYCQRVNQSWWTAWEKLDADIQGDHLIPIVWNRRLHLFWALFTEKQEKGPIVMPAPNQPLNTPRSFWEIKIAWAERKQSKWQPKLVSDAYLTCAKSGSQFEEEDMSPSQGRTLITFRAAPNPDTGELYIRCYNPGHLGDFYFNGIRGQPLARKPFLFNVRSPLAPLSIIQIPIRLFDAVKPPAQSRIQNMGFAEDDVSDGQLWLRTDKVDALAVLGRTPGSKYRLTVPHQDFEFASKRPFWFQHDNTSFFVEPRDVNFGPILVPRFRVNPALLDGSLAAPYYNVPIIVKPPISYPRPDRNGPLQFTPSFEPKSDLVELSRVTGGITDVPLPRTTMASWASSGVPLQGVSTALGPIKQIDTSKFRFPPVKSTEIQSKLFSFSTFYHPFVSELIRVLNRDGIDGLYQRPLQMLETEKFQSGYSPAFSVEQPYPSELVDFDGGFYANYNWELFLHIPLIIADRLSKNQQFALAQKWYHYVFNPMEDSTDIPVRQRCWITKKLFQVSSEDYANQTIKAILNFLAKGGDPALRSTLSSEALKYLDQLEQNVSRWRMEPFKPFVVARARVTAFQKSVIMKYLDNLIAWGDSLFSGDTIELINEATQIYVLAANVLGPRPLEMAPRAVPEVQTYNSLQSKLDAYGNALAAIEELVPPLTNQNMIIAPNTMPVATSPSVTYFCSSKNEKLLGYWDTIADRLFKIRHCMNLMGIVRELPLFEPPIDPALLVRAAAAGVDLSSAVADMSAPLPHHRFYYLAAKSTELCQELKSLGAGMLAAMEKKDASQLALLQSNHSMKLLDAMTDVRLKQMDDATKVVDAMNKTKDVVTERYNHYYDRAFINELEAAHVALEGILMVPGLVDAGSQLVAAVLHFIPELKIGAPTTFGGSFGGSNVGKSTSKFSKFMKRNADLMGQTSRMMSEMAGFQRRKEEWDFQARLANKELLSLDAQIESANIRYAIADKERQNHQLQVDQAKEIDDFFRSKFTAMELYDWTLSQLSAVYFQTYRLVYDTAKRAERAYALELGVQQPAFIAFDYWNSLRKGLTAGERLFNDIKRMEMSYMDQDIREYELTKSISLAQLDPVALVRLRQNGSCFFRIPEAVFDLNYPSHYMRRIKAVSVSIPCVTGPYTSVCSTLSLLQSSVRTSANLSGGKYARRDNDPRFTDSFGQFQSIATSTGVNDTGVFEPNLRDERYLPFERCGVISSWSMQLPIDFPQYDYDTISDVILNIRYTSREGGAALASQAAAELREKTLDAIALAESQNGLARLFDVPNEFPSAWRRFLTAPQAPDPNAAAPNQTVLPITLGRFPYVFAGAKSIKITKADIFVRIKPEHVATHNTATLKLTFSASSTPPSDALTLSAWTPVPGAPNAKPGSVFRASVMIGKSVGDYYLTGQLNSNSGTKPIDSEAFGQFLVVCYYHVTWRNSTET